MLAREWSTSGRISVLNSFCIPLYFLVPMKRTGISRRKFLGAATAAASLSILPAELRSAAKLAATGENPSTIRVSSSATPIMFDPDQALGSSMDILSHDVIEKIYTEP